MFAEPESNFQAPWLVCRNRKQEQGLGTTIPWRRLSPSRTMENSHASHGPYPGRRAKKHGKTDAPPAPDACARFLRTALAPGLERAYGRSTEFFSCAVAQRRRRSRRMIKAKRTQAVLALRGSRDEP
jgi:hypothetical protein